jgi:hypothetical protein
MQYFHPAFNLLQRELLGAIATQPEIFHSLIIGLRKAKKSAAVQAHQGFGALRIGAF